MSDLMTEKEAAARLRRSVKTLAKLRKAGQIGFVRMGTHRGIFYTEEQLQEFRAARTVAATTPPPPPPTPKYRRTGVNSAQNREALIDMI